MSEPKSSTHTCPNCAGPLVLTMDKYHKYTMECACGKRFSESVTQILEKSARAPFGAAAWHGQTVGIEGVQALLRSRDLHSSTLISLPPGDITRKLTANKLTVNHRRDAAGILGTTIHKALENYGTDGTLPDVSSFKANERPRIRGVATFLAKYRPEFVATEVQVVSVKHRFAGTFDFLANVHGETYRHKGELKFRPSDKVTFILGDLKTAKRVYKAKNFCQLEAYEGARVEAGEAPTDMRAVVWVGEAGEMELVPSTASYDDFLALKASAEVITRLDGEGR